MSLSIFDIPEVIDGIARHLTSHDLSICLRVNKTWYRDFLRLIWEDVHTYDFDFNHGEWSIFEPERYEGEDPDRDRYGRHNVAKYSRLIRSLTTRSLKSLIDLGPGCVNLEELSFGDYNTFKTCPDSSSGFQEWMFRSMEFEDQSTETWVQLLKRNPNLRLVKVMFSNKDDQTRIVEALSELQHLEELLICGDYGVHILQTTVEYVLQKMNKHLRKLSLRSEETMVISSSSIPWQRLQNNESIQEIVFEKVFASDYVRLLPNLKTLGLQDIRLVQSPPMSAQETLESIGPILSRYCPKLEHLQLSSVPSPGLEKLIPYCPQLKEFTFKCTVLDATVVAALTRYCHGTLRQFSYQMSNQPYFSFQPFQDQETRRGLEEALVNLLRTCSQLISFKAFALFEIGILKDLDWSSEDLKEIGISVDALGSRGEGRGPLLEESGEVQRGKVRDMFGIEGGNGVDQMTRRNSKWERIKGLEMYGVPGGTEWVPELENEFSRMKSLTWITQHRIF